MDGSSRALEKEAQGEACLAISKERPAVQITVEKQTIGGKTSPTAHLGSSLCGASG